MEYITIYYLYTKKTNANTMTKMFMVNAGVYIENTILFDAGREMLKYIEQ